MPSPAKLSVYIEERGDDSALNVLGQRLVDRLAVKRVIDISWPYLAGESAAALMAAVTEGVFFDAVYPDPVTGGMREASFRATERSARMLRMADGGAVWTDIEMKWEER